jgi:hypothetical protein
MSQAPSVNAQSHYPNPTFSLEAAGVTTLLSTVFAGLTAAQGAIIALCAEVGARVAILAARHFTQYDAVANTAARFGRVLGGYFLANVVIQTPGFVPLAFGIWSVLLPLASGAYIDMAESCRLRV